MPYQLHIVRYDEERNKEIAISREDWLALCAKDSSLERKELMSRKNPDTGEVITMSALEVAIWRAPDTQAEYLLDYRRGKISFTYSEKALIKALEIALELDAIIVGEEGERY